MAGSICPLIAFDDLSKKVGEIHCQKFFSNFNLVPYDLFATLALEEHIKIQLFFKMLKISQNGLINLEGWCLLFLFLLFFFIKFSLSF